MTTASSIVIFCVPLPSLLIYIIYTHIYMSIHMKRKKGMDVEFLILHQGISHEEDRF